MFMLYVQVTAMAKHPNGRLVATGQSGRNSAIMVWDARAQCEHSDDVDDDDCATSSLLHATCLKARLTGAVQLQ
jgi:hypothetical protein